MIIFNAFLVLSFNWQEVAQQVQILEDKLNQGDFSALNETRNVILNLTAPPNLVTEYTDIILLATVIL